MMIINLAVERNKRLAVVELRINDGIDFEELKDFLEAIEPDDYEIRMDALTLAIRQMSIHASYYGADTVLKTAEEFYKFLKGC